MKPHQGDLPFAIISDPRRALYEEFGVQIALRCFVTDGLGAPDLRGHLRAGPAANVTPHVMVGCFSESFACMAVGRASRPGLARKFVQFPRAHVFAVVGGSAATQPASDSKTRSARSVLDRG